MAGVLCSRHTGRRSARIGSPRLWSRHAVRIHVHIHMPALHQAALEFIALLWRQQPVAKLLRNAMQRERQLPMLEDFAMGPGLRAAFRAGGTVLAALGAQWAGAGRTTCGRSSEASQSGWAWGRRRCGGCGGGSMCVASGITHATTQDVVLQASYEGIRVRIARHQPHSHRCACPAAYPFLPV